MSKSIHLVNHSDRRLYDRISAYRTGTFAQAQSDAQNRVCMQGVQYEAMAGLIALVSKDSVIRDVRIEFTGGQQAVRHDKTVDEYNHSVLGGAQHAAHRHIHLESAEPTQIALCGTVSSIVLDCFL